MERFDKEAREIETALTPAAAEAFVLFCRGLLVGSDAVAKIKAAAGCVPNIATQRAIGYIRAQGPDKPLSARAEMYWRTRSML